MLGDFAAIEKVEAERFRINAGGHGRAEADSPHLDAAVHI